MVNLQKRPAEEVPVYAARGGARVGIMNMSSPLAKIEVYRNHLILRRLFCRAIHLQKKDVLFAKAEMGLFRGSTQFVHSDATLALSVIFWNNDQDGLLRALRQAGIRLVKHKPESWLVRYRRYMG